MVADVLAKVLIQFYTYINHALGFGNIGYMLYLKKTRNTKIQFHITKIPNEEPSLEIPN